MYQRMSVEPLQESGTAALRFVIGNSAALLDANEIDKLILQLGQIRAHMLPAPPPQPEASTSYPLEIDPCWHVDRTPIFEGVVLLLRHAGYGWLAFSLPPPSLSRLDMALTAQPSMQFAMSSLVN
ncbi:MULTISPECIES: hypothetical protein [Paraburkholderia]|jgi:hypothetical protein|uniref:Uncharacterized protein n=1 Tax=Paraburkholderia phenazinium TaxID=60549 RepID=A0A1N6GUN3_9BURK|nr:hypothetical protein [Paraburkholderia phenazinium]SIO11239.1 hypothetical protein SAMN05444165_0977 [Paraburkholderia phenazinium]